jgi:hypothetical protein
MKSPAAVVILAAVTLPLTDCPVKPDPPKSLVGLAHNNMEVLQTDLFTELNERGNGTHLAYRQSQGQ